MTRSVFAVIIVLLASVLCSFDNLNCCQPSSFTVQHTTSITNAPSVLFSSSSNGTLFSFDSNFAFVDTTLLSDPSDNGVLRAVSTRTVFNATTSSVAFISGETCVLVPLNSTRFRASNCFGRRHSAPWSGETETIGLDLVGLGWVAPVFRDTLSNPGHFTLERKNLVQPASPVCAKLSEEATVLNGNGVPTIVYRSRFYNLKRTTFDHSVFEVPPGCNPIKASDAFFPGLIY